MQKLEVTEISISPELMGLTIGAKNMETDEEYAISMDASMIGFARDAFGAILGNIGLNSIVQATQGTAQQSASIETDEEDQNKDDVPEPKDAAE